MKIRKSSIIFLISVLLLSSISLFASADAGRVTIESFTDSILLTWDTPGDNYIISDINNDNSVIYEGSERQTQIDNLFPDTLHRYKLSSYNANGVLLQQYYLSTNTKNDSTSLQSVNEAALDINVTDVVVSKDKVVLSWDAIPGVREYNIYKNGELIATVNETEYVDTEEMTETYIPYEIEFKLPLSETDKQEIQEHYRSIGKELSEDELNRIANKPYSMIKIVDTSIVVPELSLLAIEKSFKWTYKTFIPDDYVEDPWYNPGTWGTDIVYFGGDNRGFSSTIERYRTKTVGDSIFYDDSTPTHEAFFKDVSPTHAYDEDYNLVATEEDSGNLINRIVNSTSSSMVDVTVYHKSGNPFAVPGAEIDYQMRARTYSNGSYSFEGLHDRAPAHELYLRIDNVTNITIFNHPNEGFDYLGAPSTLARSFSISN